MSAQKKLVPISEAAKVLGVSIDTVRRWDKAGTLHSSRPDGKNRYFSIEELESHKFSKPLSIGEASEKLGISQSTLRRLEKKKVIKPSRGANSERTYDKKSLEDFLHSQYFLRQKKVQEEILEPLHEIEASSEQNEEISAPQAAKMLGVSTNKLRLLEKQGLIHSIHSSTEIAQIKSRHGPTLSEEAAYVGIGIQQELVSSTTFTQKILKLAGGALAGYALLVAVCTGLFFLYPEATGAYFGYTQPVVVVKSNVLAAETSNNQSVGGNVLGVILKPLSAASLVIVQAVSPATYEKAVPTQIIESPSGANGINGANGVNGLPGFTGPQGPTGQNGLDGTSITNGVYTTGSYLDPSWITSVSPTKVLPDQTSNNGKVLGTNGSAISWVTNSSGVAWGTVTGTLSDQSDLQTALNAKTDTSSLGTLSSQNANNVSITGGTLSGLTSVGAATFTGELTGNAGTVTGLSITTDKFLSVSNTIALAGTDSSILNIGDGGTLGSAAFTDSSAYVTGTPWTDAGYVTGAQIADVGFVQGTPWTDAGYVTGTPWTGVGYYIGDGSAFATSAQGALADSALQSLSGAVLTTDIGTTVLGTTGEIGGLTGTISSTVLGNSTAYVGTTAIALNRTSTTQSLTGITSIDGTAAGLTSQYIDWSAVSGGASIANKPTLGTISSQAASNVSITGGTLSGLTSVGATTFTGALTGNATNITGVLGATSFPVMTGDVTNTQGSLSNTIASGAVTVTKMANMATASFLGRNTAGTGSPEVLSATTAKSILAIANTDVSGLGTLSTQNSNNISVTGGSLSGLTSVGATTFTGALTGNASTVTGFSPTSGKTLSVSKTMTLTAADDTGVYTLPTGTATLLATTGSAADLTNFPTFNQSTTGTATNITGVLGATSFPAQTGDITNTQGSLANAIASGAVTLGKMANLAANSIIGNNTGIGATPIALTAAQVKTLLAISNTDVSGLGTMSTQNANAVNITGGSLSGLTSVAATTFTGALTGNATNITGVLGAASFPAMTGDVTNTQGSLSNTIASGAVTLGKMTNLAANSIIGNNTGIGATPIALTTTQVKTFLSIANTDVSGLGTMSTQNANGVAITGGTLSGLTSVGATTFTGALSGNATSATTATTTTTGNALANTDAAGQSAITAINSATTGTINTARLNSTVTTQGNTFNGISQLVQMDSSGNLPIINGSNLTGLTKSQVGLSSVENTTLSTWAGTTNINTIASGTVTLARMANLAANSIIGNNTGVGATPIALTATQLKTMLTIANTDVSGLGTMSTQNSNNISVTGGSLSGLTSVGATTFTGELTGNATNITGVLGAASFPAMTGDVTNTQGSLSNAIASGAVTLTKMANMATTSFLGRNTAGTGSPEVLSATTAKSILAIANTDVSGLGTMSTQASNNVSITGGSLSGLTSVGATTFTGALSGNATTATTGTALANTDTAGQSAITAINSATTGTINTARLNSSVTTQGNTFNGISQLVKLDTSGNLSAINGSALTGITGDQVLPTQTGNNGKFLGTNGTTVSWVTNSSAVAWGAITGTLSSQTDLNTALTGKLSTTLTSANIFVGNVSNVATGVAMTGDIGIDNTGSTTIGGGKVSLSKMTNLAANSIIGNNTGISATPIALTASQIKSLLSIANTDVSGLGTLSTQNSNSVSITGGSLSGLTSVGATTFTGALSGNATNITGVLGATSFPAQTGDVTNTQGSLANAIASGAVTLGKMASLAANSVLGNNTGVGATPIALTITQVKTLLAIANTDVSGLGTMSTQNSNNVTITGGSLSGLTSVGATTFTGTLTGNATNITGVLGASSFPAQTGDVTNTQGSLSNAIASGAVSLTKMANMATASFLGRNTAGTGAPEVLSTTTAKSILAIANTDVSGLGTMSTQASSNVSITGGSMSGLTSVGATTFTGALTGNATNITGVLGASSFPAMTGDVTNTQGSLANAIATGAVTLGKMANLAANSIIGNNTGISATPIALTTAQVKTLLAIANTDVSGLGTMSTQNASGVAITGGTLSGLTSVGATTFTGALTGNATNITGVLGASSFPAMTGDVTNTQGSLANAIASGAVTLGKMANLAANSIIGNNTGIGATPIALTTAQVKTLLAIANTDVSGLGTISTQNANNVTITGGSMSGLTSVGATTFTGALTGNATNITGVLGATSFPAMTGDVTNTQGSLANAIASGAVTLTKMANIATASFLGRNTAGTGAPEVLSATTAKLILAIANTDVSGLGTMSTQNASGVTITGGTLTGVTGLTMTLGSDATGDLYYRSAGGGIARLADIAVGSCLNSGGVGATPSWGSCGAGGGVTSVDSLTGALTIANSTGSTSIITINNAAADGSTKGIATFNSTNFSAATGVVNTIQGISTAATPTFASLTLSAITNQIVLGVTNTTTITSIAPGTSKVATIPALAANDSFVFLAQTQTLTGKTLAAGSNTISGLANSNLSGTAGITNANLANSGITFAGNSGSGAIALGGTLTISGGGINNAVYSAGTVTITGTEADTLTSVTGRNATTSNALTLSSATNNISAGTLTLTLGSDATGDLYYRGAGGSVARLADVATGSCLTSGGAGIAPSWGSCGAGGGGETDRTVFTSSSSFTKLSSTLLVVVEAWGGGGGGGGGGGAAAGTAVAGAGAGGGGVYVSKAIAGASVAASETVTVPVGGTAGTGGTSAAGVNGSKPADTVFGSGASLVTGWSGGGGAKGGTTTTYGGGGGGGGSNGSGASSTTNAGGVGGTGLNGLAAVASANATNTGGGGGGSTTTTLTGGNSFQGGGGGGGSKVGGTAGGAGGSSLQGGGGGGAGGSLAATHALSVGGAGGGVPGTAAGGGAAGGATTGTAGTAGYSSTYSTGLALSGTGGGGGASGLIVTGGKGGNGGVPAGGGGGGGAGQTVGGAGGTGGRGEVRVWSYRGTGADLAEMYSTNDESLEAGDVVAIDSSLKAGVKKSGKAYDGNTIGIVSTNPGLTIGYTDGEGVKPVLIALAGRVPVKVSLENGAISPGDLLTPSTTPGVAMKATKAGLIIGQSLTSFDGNQPGYVVAFIKNSYSTGSSLAQIPGLVLSSADSQKIVEQQTLAYLVNEREQLTQSNNISEVYTDRLTAALEIITPKLYADAIEITGSSVFMGNVEFTLTPLFNKDTAGFAVVKQGDMEVSINFDKEYVATPVINASPLWDADQAVLDVMKQLGTYILPKQDYIIVNSNTKGFSIVLDKPAVTDLKFSWIALAVKDARTVLSASTTTSFATPSPTQMPTQTPQSSPSASPSAVPVAADSPLPVPTATPLASPEPSVEAGIPQTLTILSSELGYVRLRDIPSIDGIELDQVPTGTILTYNEVDNGWYQVTYNNQTGWISGTYITLQ